MTLTNRTMSVFDEFFAVSEGCWNELNKGFSTYGEGFSTASYPTNYIVDEKDHSIILEYALAGFSKEEVKVEVDGDRLNISAEKKNKDPDNRPGYRGIAQRKLKDSFRISAAVDKEKIEAVYKDGLLRIVLTSKDKEVHEVKIK